jgi:hypothetical protein
MNKKILLMLLMIALCVSAVFFIPEWAHRVIVKSISPAQVKVASTVHDAQAIPTITGKSMDIDPALIVQLFIGKPKLPSPKRLPAKDPVFKPVKDQTLMPEDTTTTTMSSVEVELVETEPTTTEATTTTTTLAPLPIVKAPWLRMVGRITDSDNVTRLFFRNEKTRNILQVRNDGVQENDARMNRENQTSFFIELEGVIYECAKR